MNQWRFIPYHVGTAAYHMAVDEAIMLSHQQGQVPPTIRFYGWKPAACSIGYFQKAKQEINLQVLKKKGFDFVRRMTGGRMVFHHHELTYSLIASEDVFFSSLSVSQAYQQISRGLVAGFAQLGLRAVLTPPKKGRNMVKSGACFDTPSDYEVTIAGRKVVGSAQIRKNGVLLQHGSILLELDVDQLFSLLYFSSSAAKERIQSLFLRQAGAINQFTDQPKQLNEVVNAFYIGFVEGLQMKLVEGSLTVDEMKSTKRLIKEKYGSDQWNHLR